MTYKKCGSCGGTLEYTGSDSNNSYYECPYCGDQTLFPLASDGSAVIAFERTKKELFDRLSHGFEDWQAMNWDSLYRDFSAFIDAHDHLHNDIRCQLALVACLTRGFNSMDSDRTAYCKALMKSVEKMYKQQKKDLKKKLKNPGRSDSFSDYESVRAKYEKLQSDYTMGKIKV